MEALKRFEEHFVKYGNNEDALGYLGYQISTWMVVAFLQIFIASSWVQNVGMHIVFECFISFCAGYLFLAPYMIQLEDKRGVSIYKKLSYVPVGRKMIQKILIGRLLRYVRTATVVTVAVQVWVMLVVEQPKLWWNLSYAVVVAGVLPLLTGLIQIYWRK